MNGQIGYQATPPQVPPDVNPLPSSNKKKLLWIAGGVLVLALAITAIIIFSRLKQQPIASADLQYLVFWDLPGDNLEGRETQIENFIDKLGTTGDGKTRHLGFGWGIAVFTSDESRIPSQIKEGFDIARRNNIAVHFNLDDHIVWNGRPDLWNWFDPEKKGYSLENKKNVEWYDWSGTPNRRQYFSPGLTQDTPHMCFNSSTIQKEVTRIVSTIIGPALKKELDALKRENKEYLFAGITVGTEPGIDDYSGVPFLSDISPTDEHFAFFAEIAKRMKEDNAPRGPLGYCALTNAGYSKDNPPKNFKWALAEINQKFLEFWDKQFVDAGISSSRLYTHVAAQPEQEGSAPIWIVFNRYARPGWSTYPEGKLADGFAPLYDELAKHENPKWGGVEANAGSGVRWETYLARHYNHGAMLVGINSGAAEKTLETSLFASAFGDDAIAAYKKFLRGEALSESR